MESTLTRVSEEDKKKTTHNHSMSESNHVNSHRNVAVLTNYAMCLFHAGRSCIIIYIMCVLWVAWCGELFVAHKREKSDIKEAEDDGR